MDNSESISTDLYKETPEEIKIRLELEKQLSPNSLAETIFSLKVMDTMRADHEEHDGLLFITYDYYAEEWTVEHIGGIRGLISAWGEDYFEAAQGFEKKIKAENALL